MRFARYPLRRGQKPLEVVCGEMERPSIPRTSRAPATPGICLVIVGHPLDLLKVKLQTGGQYKGVADAAAKTLRSEGVSNWDTGVSLPFLSLRHAL